MERAKKAIAIGYQQGLDQAPKVLASGKNEVAERLLDLARQHGVPIRQDHVLAEALSKIDLGKEIPPELYQAVAEILVFVKRIEERAAGGRRP